MEQELLEGEEIIYVKHINQKKIDRDRCAIEFFDYELPVCYPLKIKNYDMKFSGAQIRDMMREVFGAFPEVGHNDKTGEGYLANQIDLVWYEDPAGPELYQKEMLNWYLTGCVEKKPRNEVFTYLLIEKSDHDTFSEWWADRTQDLDENALNSDEMVTTKTWCQTMWNDLNSYKEPDVMQVVQ